MRIGREAWILALLVGVFIAGTYFYAERGFQSDRETQPTTYGNGPGGAKALHLLLQRQGLQASRFERPLTRLPEDAGLLIMMEPFPRAVTDKERKALWAWVDRGGALLLMASATHTDRAKNGVTVRGVEIESRTATPATLPVPSAASPYFRDVSSVRVAGTVRLSAGGRAQKALLSDKVGAYVVAARVGRGAVIVVADGLAASNAQILAADNPVFWVNVAEAHAGGARPVVLFDEYHQGYGFAESEERSLWGAIGAPARSVFWYAVIVVVLLVYNANRRFGAARRIVRPGYRPSTEYIASMAGLFRRAGAADIALDTLYRAFSRDVRIRLDVPEEVGINQLAELAERRLGWPQASIFDLLTRCERVSAGERLPEGEAMKLAVQIQDYRRRADLVRLS